MCNSFLAGALVCWALITVCQTVQADFVTVTSTEFISIPDRGMASPYPTTLNVSGASGVVSNFTLTLSGVSHTFSDDMSAAIVSPSGTAVLLFAGPGPNFLERGVKEVVNQTWTFDDAAAATLPRATQPVSGTYKPGLFEWDDAFPDPGPALGTYGFSFASFHGEDPNGAWRLFVIDNNAGDGGQIAGGWSMTVSFEPAVVPEPATAVLFTSLAGVVGWRRFRRQTT